MKKLIYTIAFTLAGLVGMAQTNQPLPSGAVPFGATTYLSPLDSTIWLYKERDGTAIKVANWVDVDSLFGLGYTKTQVDSILARNYYTKPEVDAKFTLAPKSFSIVGAGDSDDPILVFSNGDWDENIREVGNVIFDVDSNKYMFVYSGYAGPYTNDNCYIGLATSPDGSIWTKRGQITPIGHEDPYLVKVDGEFFLYTEKKNSTTEHLGVNLFSGPNLNSLTDVGVVLDKGSGWEDKDASSPTVLVKGSEFYMFYEGRANSGNGGAVGLATSTDGVTWVKHPNNPIINGSQLPNPNIHWSTHCVPDDIIELDGTYYMSLHVWNGQYFAMGLMTSGDLVSWFDGIGTWINTGKQEFSNNGNGVPIYLEQNRLTALYVSGDAKAIYKGYFSVKVGASESYSKLESPNVPYIFPANRNAYVDISNSSTATTLMPDSFSGAGIIKNIRNTSASDITVSMGDGVTVDGGGSDLVLAPGQTVSLLSTAPNQWVSWPVYGIGTTLSNRTIASGVTHLMRSGLYSTGTATTGVPASGFSGAMLAMQSGANAGGSAYLWIKGNNSANPQAFITHSTGAGVVQPWAELYTSASASITTGQYLLSSLNTAPTSASATGTTGEIRITATYIYVCIATDTWVRAALTTW